MRDIDLWEPREGNPGLTRRSSSRGGNRMVRYRSALGSANEIRACIDVAIMLGYVESVDVEIR
jgi:hypothetical protein